MSSTGAADAWSYRAGPWFAAFGPRVTVLLPESQRDQVIGVWSLVDGGAAFDEVLDALLASGLSRLPGFVLVSTDEGPTRVLLRGAGVSASLTTDDEDVTIDGTASGTWVERSVEGVTALSVVLEEADPADERPTDFGIVTGLVRVGRIDRPPYVEPVAAADEPAEVEPEAADAVGDDVVAEDGAAVVAAPFGGMVGDDLEPAADEPAAEEPAADLTEEPAAEEPAAEPAPVEEPAAEEVTADEPSPLDEPAPFDESAPVGGAVPEQPAMEMPTGGDPLTDPMPSEPAPSGWVTPWDTPPPPPESAESPQVPESPEARDPRDPTEPTELAMTEELALGDQLPPVDDAPAGDAGSADDWITAADAAPATDQPVEPPAPMSGEPVTEFAPPSGPPAYAPPPPAYDAPPVDLPPPPLPVGSWEPIGGFQPPPPAAPDPGEMATPPAAEAPAGGGVAKLMISDGQQVLVDRVILIGRAPEARRFTDSEQPHLVTVPSRLHEISSTHIEVRPGSGADQGTAVVTDMGSTNGTVLVQPGLGPEDLKPGIAVQLVPGAIINLGDGVTIQVTRP